MYVRISSYPFQNVRNTNIFLVCLPFRVHTDIRGCFMKYFGSNVIELRSIMPSPLGKTSVDNAEKWSSPLQTNPPPPPPGPPPVAQTYTQELPGHLEQWRTISPLGVQGAASTDDSTRVQKIAGFALSGAQLTIAPLIYTQQGQRTKTNEAQHNSSTSNRPTAVASPLIPQSCQSCNLEAPWKHCETELCRRCDDPWVKRSFG